MRFQIRKKRQAPAVIIVALIDVLIVLLIFLMVTTTFKKPLPSMKLVLPQSSQAAKPGASSNPPLVVYIEEGGNLRFGPEGKPVTPDNLRTDLASERQKNSQVRVALSVDKKAPFGQIVRVFDVAKEAGITNITFFTKPSTAP